MHEATQFCTQKTRGQKRCEESVWTVHGDRYRYNKAKVKWKVYLLECIDFALGTIDDEGVGGPVCLTLRKTYPQTLKPRIEVRLL